MTQKEPMHPNRCENCNRPIGKPEGTNDCPISIPSHLDDPDVYIIEKIGCASCSPLPAPAPEQDDTIIDFLQTKIDALKIGNFNGVTTELLEEWIAELRKVKP